MTDLFDFAAERYPQRPGFANFSTSREAADSIARSAKSLRAIALKLITEAGARGLTTNELTDRMGVERDSVQPRTSELKAEGRIRDSGQRRQNLNGKRAIVWVAEEVGHG